jgi:hypothetical protein
MNESPFLKHRNILVEASYSTAMSLQSFVLSLYNGADHKFAANTLSNYDPQHMAIFVELATWYNRHTESDPDFMNVCGEMIRQRQQFARENLAELNRLLALNPNTYSEDGETGPSAHRYAVSDRRRTYESHQAGGWID